MYIAKLMYHKWEEEPISGIARGYKGTFAIFFYGCNLHCIFCQNSKISHIKYNDLVEKGNNNGLGKINYTAEELSGEMLKAEKNGACTISFITGVWFLDEIVETIKIAREKGLTIPIVYNSNGYEFTHHLKKLNGLIDIFLPDFKYYDAVLGEKFSNVKNYTDIAKECIDFMYNQGKKVIVRHLVLPSHTNDSKNVLKYLYDKYKNDICYSIMGQYTPMLKNAGIEKYAELNRKLTKREYEKVIDYAIKIGIENAFIQEGEVASESFIPEFKIIL